MRTAGVRVPRVPADIVSRDVVLERIRQARQLGEALTLAADEVSDLDAELSRLYETRAVPRRAGVARLTGDLLVDLGRVLERHHYQRAEGPGPMANFAVAAVALTCAFEGTPGQ